MRQHALAEVARCILKDRTATHGEAEDSFKDTAQVWTTILRSKLAPGQAVDAIDVSALMVALKLVRYSYNPLNVDNGLDAAGYSAIMCAQQMRAKGVTPTRSVVVSER